MSLATNSQISVVDLFCGAGGLTRGFLDAGLDVVGGFDLDPSCRFAYEANNAVPFFEQDAELLSGETLSALYNKGTVRVLAGCAPCQPFSNYTQGPKRLSRDDQRWNMLVEFLRLVRAVMPEIVCMENVPQLHAKSAFRDFFSGLVELGYAVEAEVLDCTAFEVPQMRKRLTLLASLRGRIKIPVSSGSQTPRTVRETIAHLPRIDAGGSCRTDRLHRCMGLSKTNKLRIGQSRPGGTWKDWDDELVLPCHKKFSGRGYGGVYGRMEWDKPAPTITTQCLFYGSGRFGHPEQDRAISLREAALLQTFPEDYHFFCETRSIAQRDIARFIGNAVPVKVGKALAVRIAEHVTEHYC